jgi:resuscitation-promoting factor RpfB
MVSSPPPGWYADPNGGAPRWWNGVAWEASAPAPPTGPPVASPAASLRGDVAGPTFVTFLILGGVFLLALISAGSGGVGSFVSTLGVAGVIAGIVALVRGGIRSLAVRSRGVAVGLLSAGLVIAMIGGGISAARTTSEQPQSGVQPFVATDTSPAPSPSTSPRSIVSTSTTQVEEPIPFASVSVNDPNRDAGTSAVTTAGVAGVLLVTYEITRTDGIETSRVRTDERVLVAPVDQVTSVGTRVQQAAPAAQPAAPPASTGGCDPNYSGCVPIASDVDCAGGSGNGPAYANGPVTVIGSDIYGLDSNGDGVGCE